MLIEFSVKNFKSIRERQTLSMVASKYYKEFIDENTFEVDSEEKFPRLLKSAVIYGPNASGKTSLVDAMTFVDWMVGHSAKESRLEDGVSVIPFRLSYESRSSDSEFEVNFFEEGVRYEFGFTANSERITSEWLYAYPSGKMQRWYKREYVAESDQDSYVWSKLFKGGRRRTDWRLNTRSNSLFLSAAIQLNNEQLRPVYNWFTKRLATMDPANLTASYTMERFDDAKKDILSFLSGADLFISDIRIERRKFDPSEVPNDMPSAFRDEFIKTMSGREIAEPKFYLDSIDGSGPVEFDDDEISAGTKALFKFSGPWLDVMRNKRVLLVDELDSSLHPLVVHQLIESLNSKGTQAQVIFTTHDTSILGQNILRRDQVWMIDKDEYQSSVLTPLSDYSVREDEALEKGYLAGRYGGIPFVKDFSNGN
ncbi:MULTISPECIES: ATP-binding protein [unclassified Pseudomonas]|uniref:AAA family ATPase n=1 Tax=unclassified Pseudomonas TaxID=196821 RepID=UPI0014753182|nr:MULTISPECIES: ATP-binding protein [unclassified Pseudomonas]NMX92668.1 AAA family ATPase [Pseudomonas sp. WS 5086]NMY47442.1 AAA family ATPase [Pseudomonas sp. WS 5027]